MKTFDDVNCIRAARQIERWGKVYCYTAGEDREVRVAVNQAWAVRFNFRFSPELEPDNHPMFSTDNIEEALEMLARGGRVLARETSPEPEYIVGLTKEPEAHASAGTTTP